MLSGNDLELPETAEDWTNRAYVIGIAGGTASGKTTLSNRIKKEMQENIAVLEFDNFYLGLEKGMNPDNYDFDHPNSLDFDSVYKCLKDLRFKKQTATPVYCFKSHSRLPNQRQSIEPKSFVILEGILAFYDERIRNLLDIKIFIQCDSDIALGRRLIRDMKERGRDAIEVLTRYNRFVRDDFNNYVKPYMKYADLIIPGGADNRIGVEFILENLKNHFKKMKSRPLAHDSEKRILQRLVIPDRVIKEKYRSGVFYDFDPLGSHSSLLIEGLTVKFTNSFFNAAMNYWESRISDKIKEQLASDFESPFDDLNPCIQCCTLATYLQHGMSYSKFPSIRATIICEPFLFINKIQDVLPSLSKIVKKSTKPIYVLSIMSDKLALEKVMGIEPVVRAMMLFCFNSEEELLASISLNHKGEKIDTAKLKQVFSLVPSSNIEKQIKGDVPQPAEANSLSQGSLGDSSHSLA